MGAIFFDCNGVILTTTKTKYQVRNNLIVNWERTLQNIENQKVSLMGPTSTIGSALNTFSRNKCNHREPVMSNSSEFGCKIRREMYPRTESTLHSLVSYSSAPCLNNYTLEIKQDLALRVNMSGKTHGFFFGKIT